MGTADEYVKGPFAVFEGQDWLGANLTMHILLNDAELCTWPTRPRPDQARPGLAPYMESTRPPWPGGQGGLVGRDLGMGRIPPTLPTQGQAASGSVSRGSY